MKILIFPDGANPDRRIIIENILAFYRTNSVVNIDVGDNQPYSFTAASAADADNVIQQIEAACQSSSQGFYTINKAAPPSTTTLDAIVAGYGTASLSWSAVTNANGYNIYRNDGSGAVAIASTDVTVYVDTIQAGITYTYYITAYNASGEGAASNTHTVSSLIPATPTGLAATADYYLANLTWNTIYPDANYYAIYRSTDNVIFNLQSTSPVNSFQDGSLEAGTTYYYKVSAFISGIESPLSNSVSVTPNTLLAPTTPACAPTYYSNVITWNAVAGAQTYTVSRSGVSGSGYVDIATVSTSSFTDTGLPYGTEFFYIIRANANGGTGAESSEVSGIPTPAVFISADPNPAPVTGGNITFTGVGFDASQNGQMKFGTVVVDYLPVTYLDPNNIQITTSGGITAGSVQFYYVVAGSEVTLPFLVDFV